jgi:hypothetical protein
MSTPEQDQRKEELQRIKTGYDQHTSLQFQYTTLQQNPTTSEALLGDKA